MLDIPVAVDSDLRQLPLPMSVAHVRETIAEYANFFPCLFSSDIARGYRAALGQRSLCLEGTYIGLQFQLVKTKKNVENSIQHALKFRLLS